jgi:hypothetical protein
MGFLVDDVARESLKSVIASKTVVGSMAENQ